MILPNSKKSLVLLLGAPLTIQNYNRIGIPHLGDSFNVWVFECAELLGYSKPITSSVPSFGVKVIGVHNTKQLKTFLRDLKPDYALDFIGLEPKFLRICKILKANHVKLFMQRTGPLPMVGAFPRQEAQVKSVNISNIIPISASSNHQLNFQIRKYIRKFNRVLRKFFHKIKFEFFIFQFKRLGNIGALLAGDASLDKITQHTNPILWIGSNDYHDFHLISDVSKHPNTPILYEGRFILFIDDCIAEANDWNLLNRDAPVVPGKYYAEMRRTFDNLENILGMKVIIAGHPNAETDVEYSAKFGFRDIYFGMTANLAKQATICAVHFSTATSFAVLAKKPILSLTSEDLLKNWYGERIATMSALLNTTLISISAPIQKSTLAGVLNVDLDKYEIYRQNYLYGSACSETAPWQEFINFVRQN
jgi:hypothetical protein